MWAAIKGWFLGEPKISGYIYVRRSGDNKHYFVVTGLNNRVVVTSETYESKQACQKGIHSLLAITRGAYVIKDFTLGN